MREHVVELGKPLHREGPASSVYVSKAVDDSGGRLTRLRVVLVFDCSPSSFLGGKLLAYFNHVLTHAATLVVLVFDCSPSSFVGGKLLAYFRPRAHARGYVGRAYIAIIDRYGRV